MLHTTMATAWLPKTMGLLLQDRIAGKLTVARCVYTGEDMIFAVIINNRWVFDVLDASAIVLWAHEDAARTPLETAGEFASLADSQGR